MYYLIPSIISILLFAIQALLWINGDGKKYLPLLCGISSMSWMIYFFVGYCAGNIKLY